MGLIFSCRLKTFIWLSSPDPLRPLPESLNSVTLFSSEASLACMSVPTAWTNQGAGIRHSTSCTTKLMDSQIQLQALRSGEVFWSLSGIR